MAKLLERGMDYRNVFNISSLQKYFKAYLATGDEIPQLLFLMNDVRGYDTVPIFMAFSPSCGR